MYYYITYWSNLDETWGEDTIWAHSEESARRIFFESNANQDCEIVSVENE
jgi:hypothetical protein